MCEIFKFCALNEDSILSDGNSTISGSDRSHLPLSIYNLISDSTASSETLKQPGLLINLIGSNSNIRTTLRPKLLHDFSVELREVAEKTDAWFMTDGTSSSISKIIGSIKENSGGKWPVIGCCRSTDIR